MPSIDNLVHETSSTTGTGNLTLANVNGKRSFNTSFGTGGTDVFYYFISNRNAAEWEYGTGHLSASTTLVRDTVIGSSNADAAVNFSAGTKDVTNAIPAEHYRQVLSANRTYYVRTDGSDSNDGLTNSSGGAFATIQHAIDVVAALDLSIYDVTIKLGNTGSYAGASITAPFVGGPGSSVTLDGDTAAPGSYVITSTIGVSGGASLSVQGVDFTPSSGYALTCTTGAKVTLSGAVIFGAAASTAHIYVASHGYLIVSANYTIDGSSAYHIEAHSYGVLIAGGLTVTLTGTPAFTAFAYSENAFIQLNSNTYSGSATGSRYNANVNGIIQTFGGGATYLPGDSAGSTATQGQYL